MSDILTLKQFEDSETQEELDAPNYLDWSDERLGLFVRMLVKEIERNHEMTETTALKVVTAAKILIDACIENKMGSMTQEFHIQEDKGLSLGDWVVEIRQKHSGKDPKRWIGKATLPERTAEEITSNETEMENRNG